MVCGSIGYGGIEKIQKLYDLLKAKGFDTANHLLEKGMDYSHINDFRDWPELSKGIVEHDLRHVDMADVLIVVANGPSYGTGMEMAVAKDAGKKIILLADDPMPTPWPVHFSDFVVRGEQELFQLLSCMQEEGL
jgi:nucleoside 2-deoxyribosyltransferase